MRTSFVGTGAHQHADVFRGSAVVRTRDADTSDEPTGARARCRGHPETRTRALRRRTLENLRGGQATLHATHRVRGQRIGSGVHEPLGSETRHDASRRPG